MQTAKHKTMNTNSNKILVLVPFVILFIQGCYNGIIEKNLSNENTEIRKWDSEFCSRLSLSNVLEDSIKYLNIPDSLAVDFIIGSYDIRTNYYATIAVAEKLMFCKVGQDYSTRKWIDGLLRIKHEQRKQIEYKRSNVETLENAVDPMLAEIIQFTALENGACISHVDNKHQCISSRFKLKFCPAIINKDTIHSGPVISTIKADDTTVISNIEGWVD
jgi:hypothetical protein